MQQIANIVSGYTFRGSIEHDSNGDIFVLQAKHIQIDQDIDDISHFTIISEASLRNPFFLQHNDIVLVARGAGLGTFRSAVFTSKESKVMASSSVHIIRIHDVTVLPKYVSLYLNSEVGQKELLQIVTGATIQTILIKNLQDFKIPIPPIHIQKSIIALHENLQEQEKIIKRKQEIQKTIINASFAKLITNYYDY